MKKIIFLFVTIIVSATAFAQSILEFDYRVDENGNIIFDVIQNDGKIETSPINFFSLLLNDRLINSSAAKTETDGNEVHAVFSEGLAVVINNVKDESRGKAFEVIFSNQTDTELKLANIVPFGVNDKYVFITADGPEDGVNYLSRSKLFRPGVGPVGVVLPDNLWHLGFCSVELNDGISVTAIARRGESENSDVRRWYTKLKEDGFVKYKFYIEVHEGDWKSGLKIMFQDRWLYDLEEFDNSLFERKDLEWVRHDYVMTIQMAWDQAYHDALENKYYFEDILEDAEPLFGGYDSYQLWPTWPRLGLDQRNQFDLYRDLPGGIEEIKRQVDYAHSKDVKYFIAYNPWDASTRKEDHLKGMADLIRDTDADGVILDTRGESSAELQEAADAVKEGIVMYSEGMAIPKHMPGIVSGRVHDAIYMPPPVNMNKYIKPEFAIFRVLQPKDGHIHREIGVSFFNGYGVEINIMRAGRPHWLEAEYKYLGRTTKILRENTDNFLSRDWEPLIESKKDSIWVNKWPSDDKVIYTIYGLIPEGFDSPLFEVEPEDDFHYVSLWNHEELVPEEVNGKFYVKSSTEAFNESWLGTRKEGSVDCIAQLPKLLDVKLDGDSLKFGSKKGSEILIWSGSTEYSNSPQKFDIDYKTISLMEYFPKKEEKFIVQLFDNGKLLDERIVDIGLGAPRLISRIERTEPAETTPEGMVKVTGGEYIFMMEPTEDPNPVVFYPDYSSPRNINIKTFYMDKYPVTNQQYYEFMQESGYQPADKSNFLAHWENRKPPVGKENHPVINVNMDDAKAYAEWAGKRLPTSIEWQYAAQGTDERIYPWGNEFDSDKCNDGLNHTTPVDAYPEGASPFGVEDMVGNVWQLTNDIYDNASYYFGILRGGSYYNPSSSIWYVVGGAWPVTKHQMLLLVGPGFDRNATVGFRCVKDAQ
ncbi:MAG: formylglycine-generating enzyme family protein [Melioribacteraceae bacterium]|nr:formylglycine-generating enzyme family protein [Melioribacteraceae bacterium]MCF8353159.1 formylglycine-generating enzyme family protein [Melioribacteraceae bacterium]MCF8393141.1 formylglycine-generating enzyme family protein [Melioribacteraceae bacterium]MCF8418044.1 formylglycine-generating enzyme family protein [Melioribacteraceae bacterium]